MKSIARAVALTLTLLMAVAPAAWAGPCANQPDLANAVRALEQARAALERVTTDKGGQRTKAIEHVDKALAAANAACAYNDTH